MTTPASLPPESHRPRRRRRIVLVVVTLTALLAAVLAFGVFEVHTLFIEDEVAEAGPVFESGATLPPAPAQPEAEGAGEPGPTDPPPKGAETPVVTTVSSGTFESRGHPGEGTAVLLTDEAQTFLRFEDDFSTDNGPDLRVRAVVDGERVDLGELKGNRGAQNYELPAEVDPSSVTAIDVWCRRFDYVFTEATVT